VRSPSRSAPRRGGLSVRISAWGSGPVERGEPGATRDAAAGPVDWAKQGRGSIPRSRVALVGWGPELSGIRGLGRRPADGRGPWPAVLGEPGRNPGLPSGRSPRSPSGVCAPADRLPRHRVAGGCGYALYSDQRWLSRKTVSWDFDRAPTLLATI